LGAFGLDSVLVYGPYCQVALLSPEGEPAGESLMGILVALLIVAGLL